jgi:hypothetical protein
MRRLLLVSMILLGLSSTGFAQVDDIYSDGTEQRKATDDDRYMDRNYSRAMNGDRGSSPQHADNGDVVNSYDDPDDYIDQDDVSYGSRINRFYYPFSNMGYYSMFYNPSWYNPFWYDPFWGHNPWRRGWGVSAGWGWGGSVGWGWNTWCGYPAWGSGWGGGFGWGWGGGWGNGFGCGNGWGWGGGFNNWGGGYWNRVAQVNYDYRPYRNSVSYGAGRVYQTGFGAVRGSGSGLRMQNSQPYQRPYAFGNPRGGAGYNGNYNNAARSMPQQRGGINRAFGGSRGVGNAPGGNPRGGIFRGSPNYGGGSGRNFGGTPQRSYGGGAPQRSFGGGAPQRSFGGAPRSFSSPSGGGRSFGAGGGGARGGGGAPARAPSGGGRGR